jgi:hypothetical protein
MACLTVPRDLFEGTKVNYTIQPRIGTDKANFTSAILEMQCYLNAIFNNCWQKYPRLKSFYT